MDADELREHLAYTCSEQSYIFVAHPIASTPMYNPERHLSSYRDIYNLFGKNFINFQRKTFMGDPIFVETFDVMGHSYLTHVPFEADRANFRRYLDIRRGWLMGYFHKEFFKTALRLLSLKKIYVNQIGTVEPTCDFNTWSKRLERKCHDLNEKYPGFFCNRLQEFLTKVHKNINNEKLFEDEVDVVLPQKTEKLKEERPSSEWKLVIAQVEQYKQNYNCGFFYGVLDYWLINITESMSRSLPEIYPFCSRENQRRLRCAKHARLPITCDAKDDDGPEVKKQKIAFIFEKPLPNNYNAFANYWAMNTFPDYSIWEIRQKTHYVKDPVEVRNELIDTFRTFHMLYGRHFLNMYHKMLKDSLDEQRKEFPKPPMEGILDNIDLSFLAVNPVATVENNLRNILQLERKSQWYLRSVFVYIFNTANVLLARKDFYVKMIGNVQEREDWYQWSEELENRCRMLNKKFPGFFSARLEDFYRSTTREIKRTAQYNVQEETKGYTDNMEEKGMFRVKEFGCGPPFYKIAPGENISKKKNKPWNWVIGKIEAYKNNPFCGYFYSILEHWLNKMELSMKIVLTEVESKYWPDNMRTEEWTKKRTLEFYNLQVEKAESSAEREKWLSIYGGRPLPSFSDAFTNYIRKGVYGPVTMWREHVTNENSAQPEKHVMKQS